MMVQTARDDCQAHAVRNDAIVSLCDRRIRKHDAQAPSGERFERTQHVAADQRSLAARAGECAVACAAMAVLLMLWSFAKIAGAFALNDE
jgi:hypothetical protein